MRGSPLQGPERHLLLLLLIIIIIVLITSLSISLSLYVYIYIYIYISFSLSLSIYIYMDILPACKRVGTVAGDAELPVSVIKIMCICVYICTYDMCVCIYIYIYTCVLSYIIAYHMIVYYVMLYCITVHYVIIKTFLRRGGLLGRAALKSPEQGLESSFCRWTAWPGLA